MTFSYIGVAYDKKSDKMQVGTMQIVTGVISIKNIFEINRNSFIEKYGDFVRQVSKDQVEKIIRCRDPEVGCITYRCDCGAVKRVGFSCKSRFCNSCGTPASDMWIRQLLGWWPKELVYRHLIFTIPITLRSFFLRHRICLRILEQTATQVIIYFFRKKYKVLPGIMNVIHTFGAQLQWNPHIHMICTNGGFTDDYIYKAISHLPYPMLYHAWKVHLIKNLKAWCYEHIADSVCAHEIRLLNDLYNEIDDEGKQKQWFIHFGQASGFHKTIASYIGRYLKRPTIAQSRITGYSSNDITYTYIDKYDGDRKENTVSIEEFIKLLIQHIPNRYFHMAVYRGAFANRCKKRYLSTLHRFRAYRDNPLIPKRYLHRLCRTLGKDPLLCICGDRMRLYCIYISGYPTKYFDTS